MKPLILNKLTSYNLLKFLPRRSLIKKRSVKNYPPNYFKENYSELVKRTFFKTFVILPQGTKPQVQIPLVERSQDSSSLLHVAFDLILVVLRIIFISSVAFGLFTFYWTTRLLRIDDAFPPVLFKAIELLGPTFIKFGQWIATRRDLFPIEFCSTLARLQRCTTSHSWIYTKHLLEATYGPNWKELFVKFDSTAPIGSGCCAQVYKAWIDRETAININREPKVSSLIENRVFKKEETFQSDKLKSNSESTKYYPVAVKILHPGIEERLDRDLRVMRFISEGLEFIFPSVKWLSIVDCVEEFSKIMKEQVNMELEAFNLTKFSRNFSGITEIVFPNPIMEYTHRRILVESFHNGSCISDYLECTDNNLKHRLAKLGIATVLKMIFKDNFVHCDLHPGNILVEKSKSQEIRFCDIFQKIRNFFSENKDGLRLVILDCGLVASLDERCRQNFEDVFRSVAQGDGEMAGEYMISHTKSRVPNPEGFKKALDLIVQTHLKNRVTLENVNVSTVVAELFSAMVRYQVKQDGSFSSVILSIAVIEGLGRSLDPSIDMISELLPFVLGNELQTD